MEIIYFYNNYKVYDIDKSQSYVVDSINWFNYLLLIKVTLTFSMKNNFSMDVTKGINYGIAYFKLTYI